MHSRVSIATAAAFVTGLLVLSPATAGPLPTAAGPALSAGADNNLVSEVQYYGHRYRRGGDYGYGYAYGRGGRGYVSPQAGVRCGNHGCWRNDRYGRPTGERMYYGNRSRYRY